MPAGRGGGELDRAGGERRRCLLVRGPGGVSHRARAGGAAAVGGGARRVAGGAGWRRIGGGVRRRGVRCGAGCSGSRGGSDAARGSGRRWRGRTGAGIGKEGCGERRGAGWRVRRVRGHADRRGRGARADGGCYCRPCAFRRSGRQRCRCGTPHGSGACRCARRCAFRRSESRHRRRGSDAWHGCGRCRPQNAGGRGGASAFRHSGQCRCGVRRGSGAWHGCGRCTFRCSG